HTRFSRDWSSDVCSSDLLAGLARDHAPRLRIVHVWDAASSGGLTGPIDADVLGVALAELGLPHLEGVEIMVCGPAPMMDVVLPRSGGRRVGKEGRQRGVG